MISQDCSQTQINAYEQACDLHEYLSCMICTMASKIGAQIGGLPLSE